MLEQPGIKEKQLELVQLIKGAKRMLHLGDIVDAVKHTGCNNMVFVCFLLEIFEGIQCQVSILEDDTAESEGGLCLRQPGGSLRARRN